MSRPWTGAYAAAVSTPATVHRRRYPLFADLAVVATMLAFAVLGSYGESHPNGENHIPASAVAPLPAYLLVAAGSLVLFWRYRRPMTTWCIAGLHAGLHCFGYENGAALLNPVVALSPSSRRPGNHAAGGLGSLRKAWETAASPASCWPLHRGPQSLRSVGRRVRTSSRPGVRRPVRRDRGGESAGLHRRHQPARRGCRAQP